MIRRRLMVLTEKEMENMRMDTGSFVGDGTVSVYITLDYEPDIIYIIREDRDLPGAVAAAGIYALVIVRDIVAQTSYASNASSGSSSNGGYTYDISGLYGDTTKYAVYADGILTVSASPAQRQWANGVTYNWKTIKW